MPTIPFSKIRQMYQTGQSAGAVNRSELIGNPAHPNVNVADSRLLNAEVENTLDVINSPRRCSLILTPFLSEYPNLVNKMNRYATWATRDSLKRHEAPICSTLFYYSTLNIHVQIEKDIGLQSMLSWIPNCDVLAIYCDYGITQAMDLCIKVGKMKGTHLEYRTIIDR